MAAILDAVSYPSIRAAIDVTLDTAVLPDATIEMPIFKDAADLDIKRRTPTWATIVAGGPSDALTHLTNAAIYLTAALLVVAIPHLTREVLPEYDIRLDNTSPKDKAIILRERAFEELAWVTDGSAGPELPTFFDAVPGLRNRPSTFQRRYNGYRPGWW